MSLPETETYDLMVDHRPHSVTMTHNGSHFNLACPSLGFMTESYFTPLNATEEMIKLIQADSDRFPYYFLVPMTVQFSCGKWQAKSKEWKFDSKEWDNPTLAVKEVKSHVYYFLETLVRQKILQSFLASYQGLVYRNQEDIPKDVSIDLPSDYLFTVAVMTLHPGMIR